MTCFAKAFEKNLFNYLYLVENLIATSLWREKYEGDNILQIAHPSPSLHTHLFFIHLYVIEYQSFFFFFRSFFPPQQRLFVC